MHCSLLASPNGHLRKCVEHLWSVALGQRRQCTHIRGLIHLDVQEGVNISAQLWTVGKGMGGGGCNATAVCMRACLLVSECNIHSMTTNQNQKVKSCNNLAVVKQSLTLANVHVQLLL